MIYRNEREDNFKAKEKLERDVERLEFFKTNLEKQKKSLEDELAFKIDEISTLKVLFILCLL